MGVVPSKFCYGDGENQPPHLVSKSEFSMDSRREDGLSVYCKSCAAARQRAWKHANPQKVREAKKKYLRRTKEERENGE